MGNIISIEAGDYVVEVHNHNDCLLMLSDLARSLLVFGGPLEVNLIMEHCRNYNHQEKKFKKEIKK